MREDATDERTVSAREAAALLGIKRATLYSYVSRGWIRTVPDPASPKLRRYLLADLRHLKARHDARAGHGPVAAAALDWGEPVVDSAITRIDPVRGPIYRGRAALDLAAERVPFEQVVAWLWRDDAAEAERACAPQLPPEALALLARREPCTGASEPASRLAMLLAVVALGDEARFAAPREAELRRAHGLLALLAGHALGTPRRDPAGGGAGLLHGGERSLAAALLGAAGLAPRAGHLEAVDAALVLCADHELNASTFAARVAASTGADLYACLGAALGALSGPRHGGATRRVEALLDEAARAPDAASALRERLGRGESLPGFGHRLYAQGDPRAQTLVALADALDRGADPWLARAGALAEAAAQAGHPLPTLDFGLVVLARALGLPRGAALAIFALGRAAGWVAHVLEQREHPGVLRPRARYMDSG